MRYFLTLFFIISSLKIVAQHEISSDTLQRIEQETMQILSEENESKINSFGQFQQKKITLPDNILAKKFDNKWLKELADKSVFTQWNQEISLPTESTNYDELSTQVLKERLRLLNQKSPITIEYNPILEDVIKTFLKKKRSFIERMLKVSQFYFPMFEQEMNKHNIPLEMKYLAIIESALNPKAKSRAGAAGLWQFMYHTGKMYGLEVNNYLDERSDPVLSTQAAMRYLSKLYEVFGDWDLVLASYNSGPGTITKAIRRSGGKTNYWNLRSYLPSETANYVPAFLATMYIFEYAKEHGFTQKKHENIFFQTDTIRVKQTIPFKEIAPVVGMSVEEIEFLNPSYAMGVVPFVDGKDYALRLPIEVLGEFVTNEENIYAFLEEERNKAEKPLPNLVQVEAKIPKSKAATNYKVKRGDTLGKIASKYHISIHQLKKWNKIKGDRINLGQKLIIKS